MWLAARLALWLALWLAGWIQAADAMPWTADDTGARLAVHEPSGAIVLCRADGSGRIAVLDGPVRLVTLAWAGETLVGAGPDGTFVWSTATGALLHAMPIDGPVAVSPDGRFVATHDRLLEVGVAAPLDRFDADAVAFADDGGSFAAVVDGAPIVRPLVARPPDPQRRRRPRSAAPARGGPT
ncbi:MAG: hypothetical protein ABMB14_22520 [Myxococcota bacterium]